MTADEIFPYSALPKVTVTECPICDTPTGKVLPQRDRYGYPIAVAFCPTCHLSYHAQQLTRDGYARLYNGAYRALVATKGTVPSPRDAQQQIGGALRPWLRGRVPSGGRLLDAGGSTGGMIPALGMQPDRLTVLDPAGDELARCDQAETIQGWLEDPIPGHYDGIVCLETLDHVTQPLTVLRNLRASCPTGWLLADYCVPPHFKIDHPVYWHPEAWASALRASQWTPYATCTYSNTSYPHLVSLCS